MKSFFKSVRRWMSRGGARQVLPPWHFEVLSEPSSTGFAQSEEGMFFDHVEAAGMFFNNAEAFSEMFFDHGEAC